MRIEKRGLWITLVLVGLLLTGCAAEAQAGEGGGMYGGNTEMHATHQAMGEDSPEVQATHQAMMGGGGDPALRSTHQAMGGGAGGGGMRMSAGAPQGLDLTTVQASEQGLFQVAIRSDLDPPAINQLHSWTVHIEDASGAPVENAEITFTPEMPQHGHGMPTEPRITEYLGNGDYRLDGMKFNMGGWWQFTFEVTANGQTDRVVFNQVLDSR